MRDIIKLFLREISRSTQNECNFLKEGEFFMTYDGYCEMGDSEPIKWGSSSSTKSSFARSLFHSTSQEEKAEEFQPIPTRYGKNEWRKAKAGEGTDVIFQAGDQSFTAHKIVLLARSSVFRTMYSICCSEEKGSPPVTPLQDMNPAIFKCLLRFMYTGTLSKKTQIAYASDFSKLAELLVKGDFLNLDGIGIWASEFLQRTITQRRQIPDHVYTTLFEISLKSECDELLDVLLAHAEKSYALAHAVGQASIDGLITREIWGKIKRKANYSLTSEVRSIEECNPYIRRFLGA